jgi:hypothetical protein
LTSELVERFLEEGRALSRVDWFQALFAWAKSLPLSERSEVDTRDGEPGLPTDRTR